MHEGTLGLGTTDEQSNSVPPWTGKAMNMPQTMLRLLIPATVLMLLAGHTPCAASTPPAGPAGNAWKQASGNGDSSATPVLYFPSEKVKAAFAKGGTLLGGHEDGRNFTIMAGRRDRPGAVEIHPLDTDIFYVLEGSATFITGGTAVEPKTTEPDEIRGTTIQGGESHHLAQGDVIVIPKGVPHWFREVEAPFLYYVVKVRR
jgi:quercetin dioxygenase-like cupin family protein